MNPPLRRCNECEQDVTPSLNRRKFLQATGLTAAGMLGASANLPRILANESPVKAPETSVKALYDSLTPDQRSTLCFAWDHIDAKRGLLRTRVSNNWQVTKPTINSDFFTKEQRALVREVFDGIIQPEWRPKIEKQLKDDAGGYGNSQSIAIFGAPGDGKFEFVMTGRHMTLRCDGNSADSVAFGGPIFYGHAASGFNEKPGHPGNVYWEQALAANKVYEVLDGKQRARAEAARQPSESAVAFRADHFDGISLSELSSDQKAEVQKTLEKLLEPYRQADRDEVAACLAAQGGLDKCHLAFYTDDDLGSDKVWDTWRLEGPAFVWHFRGTPHVHVWVNIAADPKVKLNADG